MTYEVTIESTDGRSETYACGGPCDQVALIYAGKVVEAQAHLCDADAKIHVIRDGVIIGPTATVGEMVKASRRLA